MNKFWQKFREEAVSILLSKLASCPRVIAHTCDLSTQDVEEGGSPVGRSFGLFDEFKISPDYLAKHSEKKKDLKMQ